MTVSYRTHHPATDGLIKVGTQCTQADFSANSGVTAFVDGVLENTHGLRAVLHNASAWIAEKPGVPLTDVLAYIMQIHVNAPYLLNYVLGRLLCGHGHVASGIIHFADHMMEHGGDKHTMYAASKATLDNTTRLLVRKLASEMKVDPITSSLTLSSEHDDIEY